jgi:predicted Zn-dependent protease
MTRERRRHSKRSRPPGHARSVGERSAEIQAGIRRLDEELDRAHVSDAWLEDAALAAGEPPIRYRHRAGGQAARELAAVAAGRSLDLAIEELADRVALPLARPATWAAIGGAGAEARRRVLDVVTAHPDVAGHPLARQHAGLDPFVRPDAPASVLVLDEGLAAPLLEDLLVAQRRPVVVLSASAVDWTHPDPPLEARTVRLPDDAAGGLAPVPAIDEILRSPALSHACALAEWGIPAPVRALAVAAGGAGAAARLESGGLFAVQDSPIGPVAVARSDRFLSDLGRRPDWRERRGGFLEAVCAALGVAEAGVAVALLHKLLLAGQERLGAMLGSAMSARLIGDEPKRLPSWARVLCRLGLPEHARPALERAAAEHPHDRTLRCEWARTLHALGREREAWKETEQLVRAGPEDVHVWRIRAELEEAQGRLDDADRSLGRALTVDPGNPALLVARGRLAVRRRMGDDADRCFGRAQEAVPGAATIWHAWAAALSEQGRLGEARSCLERAAGIESWNARHRLEGAVAAVEVGAAPAASASGAQDGPDAMRLRAQLAVAREDPAGAGALVEDVIAGADSPEVLEQAADVARRAGRFHAAVRALRQALRLAPGRAELQAAWRALLGQVGRVVEVGAARSFMPSSVPGPAMVFAADASAPAAPALMYTDGDLRVVVVEAADGDYVVVAERARRPVEGALVTLLHRDPSGRWQHRATGLTGQDGEGRIEPAQAVRDMTRSPAAEYTWHILLPPSDADGRG